MSLNTKLGTKHFLWLRSKGEISVENMIELAKELWPICRSITGSGIRESLEIIRRIVPELKIHEVPSGEKCFDWEIPLEWNINDAYIISPSGEKIIDFKKSNLHVVGYSTPINLELNLDELEPHLFSLPNQPNAIPYITSYYSENWGFCLTHNQRMKLERGKYHVRIDSSLKSGVLNYGEVFLEGESDKEVFLSTYLCHPSMANNELSGPVVVTELLKWLKQKKRKFSYRIVFIPETIGSIAYLSRNLSHLKEKVVAGYNVTCIGDDRSYSFLPSRFGDTLSDKAALHVLSHIAPDFKRYSFLDRGSDERQYCSPGVDLPIASVMRTKYGEYDEYHTSLDNFDVVTESGLLGGYEALRRCIEVIESNCTFKVRFPCEPQLGKRGLYPNMGSKKTKEIVQDMMNFLAYCDGDHSLLDIAELLDVPFNDLLNVSKRFDGSKILEVIS